MLNKLYLKKDNSYYNSMRDEIFEFLLLKQVKISANCIELGSAHGYFGRFLRESIPINKLIGVDLYVKPSKENLKFYDYFFMDDIETFLHENKTRKKFDYVFILDTLEHLQNHWDTLENLKKILHKNSILIISVPNLSNFRVIFDLVFNDKFKYKESGILDFTHLRFFTKKSIEDDITAAKYEILESKYFTFGMNLQHNVYNFCKKFFFHRFIATHIFLKVKLG
jgi:SAM-dependent methyltransferase